MTAVGVSSGIFRDIFSTEPMRRIFADENRVLLLDPKNGEAYNNLAWDLATCPKVNFRDGKKAVQYATQACELSEWKNPAFIDTLAAACAEAGDFVDAVKWENKYLEAPNQSASDVADAKKRLVLYQAHQPYHADK